MMEARPHQKRTLEYYNKNIARSEKLLNSKWYHPAVLAICGVIIGTVVRMLIDQLTGDFVLEEYFQWKTLVRLAFSWAIWFFIAKWLLKGTRKNVEEMKLQRDKLEDQISLNQ